MERLAELLSRLERLAPQWFLALVVIVLCVGLLVYNEPPHQLCDTQKKAFRSQQKKFLASSSYKRFFKRCLSSNNRGSCEPYFLGFKKLMNDFKVVNSRCIKPIAEIGALKRALGDFLIESTRIAWGDKGPESMYQRSTWLGSSHIRIFCRVKSSYQNFYGETKYKQLVKKTLKNLPNERKLTNVQKKHRSLLATPCSQYF